MAAKTYNPYDQSSGSDPRGQVQNQIGYQNQRYEQQQGPMADAFAYNYGRGSEANYGDYTDIMNNYRNIASGAGTAASGGGGGGGYQGYTAQTWNPEQISYKDPFNSYTGMTEFSNTGGYSKDDVANLRARGTAPIRASYANAEREVARQRSLQGGYSPNAFALQGRMAREQGQLGADAMQNVEAGIVKDRNAGRLSGLSGMTDIEKQRLAADLKVSEYNADAKMKAAQSNASAANSAAASNAAGSAASSAASRADQLRALQGMTTLYGTTPGMAELFGNQLLSAVGQGGSQGTQMVNAMGNAQKLPGQFDQTMDRINTVGDTAARIANPIMEYFSARKDNPQQQTTTPSTGTSSGTNYGAEGAMGPSSYDDDSEEILGPDGRPLRR
jgi:hypothetical protein